jgi:hypothetical protein
MCAITWICLAAEPGPKALTAQILEESRANRPDISTLNGLLMSGSLLVERREKASISESQRLDRRSTSIRGTAGYCSG